MAGGLQDSLFFHIGRRYSLHKKICYQNHDLRSVEVLAGVS